MYYGYGEHDLVRANTRQMVNDMIDIRTEENLNIFRNASAQDITQRIDQLDREWDIDRAVLTTYGAAGVAGALLGLVAGKRWTLLAGVAGAFSLIHMSQGWSPPVGIFRRFGVRTRNEIDLEYSSLQEFLHERQGNGHGQQVIDGPAAPYYPQHGMQEPMMEPELRSHPMGGGMDMPTEPGNMPPNPEFNPGRS